MQKLLLTLTFMALLFSSSSFAQSTTTTATDKTEKLFYAEFGGANVLFGANFDWRFKKNTRTGLGARVGLGFTIYDQEIQNSNGWDYKTTTIATIPIGLNYVFGKPNSPSMFEVGAGATVLMPAASVYRYDDDKEGNLIGHFSFMYRRVPVEGGFSWRIGFTPIINTSGQIFPSGAIGLGYAFR
jgi:hypothetical protein